MGFSSACSLGAAFTAASLNGRPRMPVEKAASTLSRRKIRGASESVKLGGGTSITSSSKRAVVASGSVELRPRIAASWERAVIIGSDLVEPRGDMSVALNSQHAVVDGSESFESSGGITSNWERAEVVASGSVESVGGESMLKPTEDLTSSSFMRKCADCGTTFDRWVRRFAVVREA